METRKYKIGVLIIGSLYWDKKCHRRKWRCDRLRKSEKQYVKVPIRYGRLSSTRGNSYTMVFSTWLCREKLGRAIVVPCAQDINTGENLVKEAECLWTAETTDGDNPHNLISAKDGWGCVALLKNPNRTICDDLHDSWTKRVCEESKYRKKIISAYGEEEIVNQCGFLKIPWPKTVDGSDLNFDALLATVTCPKPDKGRYPSAQAVADAANKSDKGREYFCKNRKHGIETFQDDEIKGHLAKCDD